MFPVPSIHFVGVGGSGMSGLATVLLEAGYTVSGCDRQRSHITDRLADLGATIYEGHSAQHLAGIDLLVASSAIPAGNPELVAARRREIPVVKRAKLLGHLMNERQGIAVAGTHGKTTTTGMIAWILVRAGLEPTIFAGGELVNLDTNARRGQGPHVVAEADEYDYSFLELSPALTVLTNVEADHPDLFENLEAVIETFDKFLNQVQAGGHVVACVDDPQVQRLIAGRDNTVTYSLTQPAEWEAHDVTLNAPVQIFSVHHHGQPVGDFRIHLPGIHNVANALGAIAAAATVGVELDVVREALAGFRGTRRRFEEKGIVNDVIVIDDYAHHPTEIRATLAAAHQRFPRRTLWAVFQPHTYSRTKALLNDFATSFTDADHVIVTDIYAARERDTLGITATDLVSQMEHTDVQHIAGLEEAAGYLAEHLRPSDVVLTLGAGDVWKVGERTLKHLALKQASSSSEQSMSLR